MTEYTKADDSILAMVREIAEAHHQHLDGAKIAVIMRDTTPSSKGREVWATISKPTAKIKPLLSDCIDYVIVISEPAWIWMEAAQKRATIDHELCHAVIDDKGGFALRGHDYEEFGAILARHGFWRNDAGEARVQAPLFKLGITVETIGKPDLPGAEDGQ